MSYLRYILKEQRIEILFYTGDIPEHVDEQLLLAPSRHACRAGRAGRARCPPGRAAPCRHRARPPAHRLFAPPDPLPYTDPLRGRLSGTGGSRETVKLTKSRRHIKKQATLVISCSLVAVICILYYLL
jgi:hypothetical protein